MNEIFLDSSYAIALSTPTDDLHQHAAALAERFEEEPVRLVTTQAILLEIGDALAKARNRRAGAELLSALHQDPRIEIVPVTQALYLRAFDLYRKRQDKEGGLTDCLSFEVMKERGITDALTADIHFHQAGFCALLREA